MPSTKWRSLVAPPDAGIANEHGQLAGALDSLRLVVAKDQHGAGTARADHVTSLSSLRTLPFNPPTPTDVLLLDYYSRELQLWTWSVEPIERSRRRYLKYDTKGSPGRGGESLAFDAADRTWDWPHLEIPTRPWLPDDRCSDRPRQALPGTDVQRGLDVQAALPYTAGSPASPASEPSSASGVPRSFVASLRSAAAPSCSVLTTAPVTALTFTSSMPARPFTLSSYE